MLNTCKMCLKKGILKGGKWPLGKFQTIEFRDLKHRKKLSAFNKNQKVETLHCNDKYKC